MTGAFSFFANCTIFFLNNCDLIQTSNIHAFQGKKVCKSCHEYIESGKMLI